MTSRNYLFKYLLLTVLFVGAFGATPWASRAQNSGPVVLLTWRAETYVPQEYEGRVLPISGSKITLAVDVADKGALASLSTQKVYWYVNEHLAAAGTGLTRTSISVSSRPGTDVLDVRVALPDYGDDGTGAAVQIPVVAPETVISIPSPAKRVGARSFEVRGLPYFFNVTDTGELAFSWQVAGTTPPAYNDPASITVTLPDNAPARQIPISLSIANPSVDFENASQEISVDFKP